MELAYNITVTLFIFVTWLAIRKTVIDIKKIIDDNF
jgi:hypothetical protein